ncbi:hypothetical protein BH23BAC1_BH23BAC1_10220 [soil metagenome]
MSNKEAPSERWTFFIISYFQIMVIYLSNFCIFIHMPEISRFYGIIIYMFANPPHFHAKYGDFKGIFNIHTGELLEGKLSGRAIR